MKIALVTDESAVQLQAVNWIKKHIDPHKFIAIDYYSNLDLDQSRFAGDPKFTNADYYWKAEDDPDIRIKKLKDNYRNVNYIMLTAQMYNDIYSFPNYTSILRKALSNSKRIAVFAVQPPKSNETLAGYVKSHPNGNWVMIYQQNTNMQNFQFAWNSYKQTFIDTSGRTIDPYAKQVVTSENQSDSLLHAVWANDPKAFNNVFNWTLNHMLTPNENLFVSSYGLAKLGKNSTINTGTSTTADENIALALLLAYNRWHDSYYLQQAEKIIPAIWANDAATIRGNRILVAGTWTSQPNNKSFIMNLSAIAPYDYKLFAKYDTGDNWTQLTLTEYNVLAECTDTILKGQKSIGIPPDWCAISQNGAVTDADNITKNSTGYSGDAMQAIWNLALDYKWTHDKRDVQYLTKMTPFWLRVWNKNDAVLSSYTHDGKPISNAESFAMYGTQIALFAVTDKSIADTMYSDKVLRQYEVENGISYWGDKKNLIDQNWVWLGYGLYTNNLQKYTK